MNFSSKFLSTLQERGFINDCTDFAGLDKLLCDQTTEKKHVGYIGFDCTANSLHIGSLTQIMILHLFQKCGHKPLILMGGGTTKVGDPSGKDKTRSILTSQKIEENMAGIKKSFTKFVEFEDEFNPNSNKAFMVNNAYWLDKLNYIEFLRDYGRHFSVNKMLGLESIKARLEREQNLSFLEFNYVLLQAYDFVELNNRYNCTIQFGGSDQWGNIVNGIELERKITAEKENTNSQKLFGITTPLLTTSSGTKMGKTADGAVWLDNKKVSAYDYWQYWRNVDDRDVIKFLKLFTNLSITEITKLEQLQGSEINKAKIVLANEATSMCHSAEDAKKSCETANKAFTENELGGAIPTFVLKEEKLSEGITIFELLVLTNLEKSNGSARRLIKGGGVKINDKKVQEEFAKVDLTNIKENKIKLSAGKKRHALITIK